MGRTLLHLALGAGTALSWYGLGTLLLARLRSSGDGALDLLNRLGAGAIGFALATAFAGWAHALYPIPFIVAWVAFALGGAVALVRHPPRVPRPRLRAWPWWQTALAGLIALYVVLILVATCAPISSGDAIFYHAAAADLFEQNHRLVELPWTWVSYQPFNVEMLVLDGFLLWDSIQGALAPAILALAAAAAVGAAATRIGGRALGLLATALFLAQPIVVWEATSVFVEPGLALCVALAAWNIWRFRDTGRLDAAVLAGVFAGGAAGMKYTGLAVAAAVGVAALLAARDRISWRAVLAYALPAVVLAAPWYVKNLIVVGDPLYPLVGGGPNAAADLAREQVLKGYGHGRSAVDAILLPFRLVGSGAAFDRGEFMSPLFVALVPAAFLDRRARRIAGVVCVAALLYLVAWFVGSQQARFLVPLMPPLAIVAAVGAFALAGRSRLGAWITVGAVAGTLAAGLGVTLLYSAQLLPPVVGLQSKDAFLEQKSSHYAGVLWLNRHLPPGAVVLTNLQNVLYLDRRYVVYTPDVVPRDAPPAEVRRVARQFGVTHIAFVQGTGLPVDAVHALGGRLVARVPVRAVTSRTLDELGPPDVLDVYRVTR